MCAQPGKPPEWANGQAAKSWRCALAVSSSQVGFKNQPVPPSELPGAARRTGVLGGCANGLVLCFRFINIHKYLIYFIMAIGIYSVFWVLYIPFGLLK